ncbi:MAG: hypothetical protein P4L20_06710 [Acidimicrobiales bacterium]|nr:hypothetical protein [Acidimicrobiales bacterium]
MSFAQEEHPIETLGAHRPDEPFGIGVGFGCAPRSAQDLDPLGAEYLVEDWAEPLVPVMNQVMDRFIAAFSCLGQVPGDLGAPGGVGGAVGHPADEDFPRVQVDEEEDMEGLQTNGLDGEEVTGDDRRGLGSHELTPGLAPGRGSTLLGHDSSDARRRDLGTELLELSSQAAVAPGRVLAGQTPDEEPHVIGDPASRHDPMTVVPLGADQVTMPAADRVGRDERRQTISDWSQALEDREHPSLLGSEPWPGHLSVEDVELLAQDQQLEVFGPRRATPEQEQAKDLSETDGGESEGHGVIVAGATRGTRGGRSAW